MPLDFDRLRNAAGRPGDRLRARYLTPLYRPDFEDLEAYCMFLGYPRSGHSLVGSLLSAHPRAVISHELDALKYLEVGFDRESLFSMILDRDREFTRNNREWTGYNYGIERLWQGCYEQLNVIGDKKGGQSTTWLGRRPDILERLRDTVDLPLRIIHVVRNPFDNISTSHRKSERTLREAVEAYFKRAGINARAREEIDDDVWFETSHEALIDDPPEVLGDLCRFLGLEPFDYYLERCDDFIFDSPSLSRHEITWPEGLVDEIETRLARHDFLSGYTFDS